MRGPAVEQIASRENAVHLLPDRNVHHLGEDCLMLGMPRHGAESLADMPVGRMQESHLDLPKPANASAAPAGSATSDGRVAHAGNGNWTSRGTGISGWETITEPGFRMPARDRLTAGRNVYSACCASARSRRPTTRNAELATTRFSTSLAVCSAPIRMMPRLRPRSEMSRITSLIGL